CVRQGIAAGWALYSW
nr:immunoglobulin heavy chain junction region [Macaca mulatta]